MRMPASKDDAEDQMAIPITQNLDATLKQIRKTPNKLEFLFCYARGMETQEN